MATKEIKLDREMKRLIKECHLLEESYNKIVMADEEKEKQRKATLEQKRKANQLTKIKIVEPIQSQEQLQKKKGRRRKNGNI